MALSSGATCVIAVPATTVHDIEFEPSLPAPVAQALGEIRYGHAAKLFVPLRSVAPASAVMSVPERYWTWTSTGDGGRVQPVVNAFAGSARALERLGVEAGPGAWVASIRELRPDLDIEENGAVLSTWSDDPWVRAAYSTPPPEEVAKALSESVGALRFAGEHTAGAFGGLMEGALRSGVRAARQVGPA